MVFLRPPRDFMGLVRKILIAPLLVLASLSNAQDASSDGSDEEIEDVDVTSVEANPSDVEELVVEGQAVDMSQRESEYYVRSVHASNRMGDRLYRLRKYREAFPHLEAAAKGGFKLAQARLGFIFLHGLNVVEKNYENLETGIGWLGVAADGVTHPEIRNYYKTVWKSMDEKWQPYMTQVVEAFIASYGSESNGVSCESARRAGSHIARMRCRFDVESDWTAQDIENAGPFNQIFGDGYQFIPATGQQVQ